MVFRYKLLGILLIALILVAGCGPAAPMATPVPPTPTEIAVEATNTPLPPTATSMPPSPTQTPLPPTATPLPTDTPLPPTRAPQPTSTPHPPLSGSGGRGVGLYPHQ